jgi:hypothetical protein
LKTAENEHLSLHFSSLTLLFFPRLLSTPQKRKEKMMPPAVRSLLSPNNVTAAAAWGGTAVTGILFLTQVRGQRFSARRAKSEREQKSVWGRVLRSCTHALFARYRTQGLSCSPYVRVT